VSPQPVNGSVVERRLDERGLHIPAAQVVPDGVRLTYRRLVRSGSTVYVAGHGPTRGDQWGYTGKVGAELSVDDGVKAAELTALNILGTIKRELGGLDGVETWLKVTGYVNAVPGFTEQARVVNGCSDLLLDLYGPERLAARTSIGVPDLPFNMPVEIDAVLVWSDQLQHERSV
jgi:enamine deaminase RidA (YjgF/YER057c/UK114 family)